eukprot:4266087-Amphidinium_carterae.1
MRDENITGDRVLNIDETAVRLETSAQRLWQPTRQQVGVVHPAARERVAVTLAPLSWPSAASAERQSAAQHADDMQRPSGNDRVALDVCGVTLSVAWPH